MKNKKKADVSGIRYTNPFDYLPGNQTPDAFDYGSNPADLQCFNCDENLQGKDFAVAVCGISARLGITALIPLCPECCEFLKNGEKQLRTEAYKRLRNKTLSLLKRRNSDD